MSFNVRMFINNIKKGKEKSFLVRLLLLTFNHYFISLFLLNFFTFDSHRERTFVTLVILEFALVCGVCVYHVDRRVEFNLEVVRATCVQIPVRGELHSPIVLNFERRLVRVHLVFVGFSGRISGKQVELDTLIAFGMPGDDIGVGHTGAVADTKPRVVAQLHIVSDLVPILVIGYLQKTLVGQASFECAHCSRQKSQTCKNHRLF